MERPRIPDYGKENNFNWEYVFSLNRYIEYLERQIKISTLPIKKESFCTTIDQCSSKKDEYYCKTNRNCKHRLIK